MNVEYKETAKEAKTTTLKGVSSLVIERLNHDPIFRKGFQQDPISALQDCGCPENLLPDRNSLTNVDFITLGKKLERAELKGEAAIAVACVVI